MTLDPVEFRNTLGSFATGVTIITTIGPDGDFVGFTASSFNSVSLDPPLILFSLDRGARSLPAFQAASHFAINVLQRGQEDLSNRFARRGEDKWAGVGYETWESGCPVFPDCLASFECRNFASHEGGDHVIFVGAVERMIAHPEGEPLLFWRGNYCGTRA